MEENHIHIYLKLYDFEIHPNEVSQKLGIEPIKTGVKGEKFFVGNKKKKLEREYSSNRWEYKETHITETKWQQNYVNDFIKRIIMPRIELINEITSQGEGELALSPHYYEEWNFGFDFNLETLKALSDSRLILNMDIYRFNKE